MKDHDRSIVLLIVLLAIITCLIGLWIVNPEPVTPTATNTAFVTKSLTATKIATFTPTKTVRPTATLTPIPPTIKPSFTPTKQNTVFPTFTPTLNATPVPTKDYRWVNCFGDVMYYPRYSWHSCTDFKHVP